MQFRRRASHGFRPYCGHAIALGCAVGLALSPLQAAAETWWRGVKEGVHSAYERGRSVSLDALATGADLAARGIDKTLRVGEDTAAFFIREGTVAEQRAVVEDLAYTALDQLFATHPEARRSFDQSAGWAVFHVRQIALGATAGYGYGLAMQRDATHPIYMKAATGGIGWSYGLGGFSADVVVLLEDDAAFDRFITQGFEVSAETRGALGSEQADATKPLSRGVSIYRITSAGLRVEATLFGTRFWPDDALNAPGVD
ncbi:hypothetical protein CKO25_16975 [Thiocapsa imhoffii]|uniref:Lipoprotein n=1 Tax=Thiocapsa imhoffii TaxID=382777 RepID=A0A9X1B9U7_9GAMM|nr:hypothetical protein [Thiocapsa imhoffii]MBK1646309.1 hypothetical protein [Thiocapsa imhoffii]